MIILKSSQLYGVNCMEFCQDKVYYSAGKDSRVYYWQLQQHPTRPENVSQKQLFYFKWVHILTGLKIINMIMNSLEKSDMPLNILSKKSLSKSMYNVYNVYTQIQIYLPTSLIQYKNLQYNSSKLLNPKYFTKLLLQ